jgi:purine-binding chemotaxis protein CheW
MSTGGELARVNPQELNMTVDLLDRTEQASGEQQVYVTLTVSGQLCGIPVLGVRDILAEQPITRIPLAPPDIAGSLNLRGRIVTAIDLRRRLNLPPPPEGQKRMSVVADQGGELYALLVDQVSEVMSLDATLFERNPPTLERNWALFSRGIYRLDGKLLVILDVARLLDYELQG